MYDHFDNNNLMAEHEYGFRRLHSTEYAAVNLIDHVNRQMEPGNTLYNLYIDLSKAFDNLSFDILIHKLRYYGFFGIELKLLISIRYRKQYLKYNTYESGIAVISTRVPQGSFLGPLLFCVYINDLILASNTLKFLMYTHNTTIYFNLEIFLSKLYWERYKQ